METKHTPGPWRVGDFGLILGGKNDGIIAQADGISKESNARLIAAAPDMLAALRGCAAALKEAGKDFALTCPLASRPNIYELHEAQARAAIQAATGE